MKNSVCRSVCSRSLFRCSDLCFAVSATVFLLCVGCSADEQGEKEAQNQTSYLASLLNAPTQASVKEDLEIIDLNGNMISSPQYNEDEDESPEPTNIRNVSVRTDWAQEQDFARTSITVNPSFEESHDAGISGWVTTNRENKTWIPASGSGHTGDVAMALTGPASKERLYVYLRSEPVEVRPGDVVDFDMWVRSEGTPKEGLTAFVQAKVGESWETLGNRARAVSAADWTQLTSLGEIMPPDTTQMRMVVYGGSNEPENVLWLVDDFCARVKSFKGYVEAPATSEPLQNILLFGIDTLRQDVLGCYGAERMHTPNIDRIAREGRRYDKVTATSPWTKPSFGSIMTGLYPSQHGAEDTELPLHSDLTTLAQALKERGYFTAAFVYTSADGFLSANMGFSKGFDVYFMGKEESSVYDALIRFLDTNAQAMRKTPGQGGLFVFYHSFDVHSPYHNHQPELIYNEGLLGQIPVINYDTYTGPMNAGTFVFDKDYNQKDVDYIKSVYESEVIYTDRLVGDVLARYDWLGLYDSLNIVFTADHGESFRENGRFEHGHGWETCVCVPMILRFPDRIEAGERDSTSLVSIMDVMPTILDLAGATSPPNLTASSLLGNREGTPTAEYGISEDQRHGWLTLRDGQYKLLAENAGKRGAWIFDLPDAPTNYMLFNIVEDPLEQQDLAESHPEELQRLKDALMAHCAKYGIGSAEETHETRSVSEETIEALEALGYTQ